MREKEQNLGSAQAQITCLRETQEKLKIELDATRSRVRETSNLLTDLQVGKRLTEFCFNVIYWNFFIRLSLQKFNFSPIFFLVFLKSEGEKENVQISRSELLVR